MKKIIALLLAVSFLIVPIYADPNEKKDYFTDISKHWARDNINHLAEIKIISGFPDDTYKPQNNVKKCEAIAIAYRMLKYENLIKENENELSKIQEKHKDILAVAQIPNWAKEPVSYFLDKKIISENEVKSFIKDKKNVPITREEACLYLGRAINQELKIKINAEMDEKLDVFEDKNEIKDENKPYVSLLYSEKIVSGIKKPDGTFFFNPKGEIKRGSFTKLIDSSMKVLEEHKKKNIKTIEAIIKSKSDKDNKILFGYDEESSREEKITDDVQIFIAGDKATYKDLEVGMEVELTLEKDILKKIIAEEIKVEKKKLGIITGVDTLNRKVYYSGSDNKAHFVIYEKDIPVYLDSEKSEFSELAIMQELSEEYMNGKISKIKVKSKSKTYTGIIKIVDTENNKITVSIGDKDFRFKISDSCQIIKNGQYAFLKQLKAGNKITIFTEYGKTKYVKTFPVMESGTITELSVDDKKNYVKVRFQDNDEKLYEIPSTVEIMINGKIASNVFDLNVTNFVNLTFDGTELIKIESVQKTNKIGRIACIKDIYSSNKIVLAQITDIYNTSGTFLYELDLKDAIIINENGGKIRVRDLNNWDEIFFYGNKTKEDAEKVYFKVEKLLVLERKK